VADRPLRLKGVEDALVGQHVGGVREIVWDLVPKALDPPDDVHASAAFRRHLAAVLAEQVITTALSRARGADPTKEP